MGGGKRVLWGAAWLAAILLPTAAAAGGGAAPLRVDVAEWSIVPSAGVVRAGDVALTVRNVGDEPHQVAVVRSLRFASPLPLRGDHASVRPLASTIVPPGESRTLVVRLRPGSYTLLDNLPWNYWKGTWVAIAVRS